MATYGPSSELTITPAGDAVRHFLLHVGEMLLAMFVGMALFGSLFSAILVAAGTSYSEALEAVPELIALGLMVEMTVPMFLWMRHRGHSTTRIAEMAGAMFAVAVAAIVLLWSSVIASTAICGVECALMLPAMVAAMLVHRGEYSRPAHRRHTEAVG